MPVRLLGVYRSVTVADLAALAADTAAVADVSIDTEQAAYPVRVDRHVRYPVGRFRTILAGPELEQAVNAGQLVAVHRVAFYHAEPIFASYVDEWYGRRLEARAAGDRAEERLCKLMLNALAGKWGQVGSALEAVDQVDPDEVGAERELDADTGTVYEWRTVGGLRSWRTRAGETRDSHPAIAATITALGRLRLLELIRRAAPGQVYYVDTDGLLVDRMGALRLVAAVAGDVIGAPRLVAVYRSVTVHGLKQYTADGVLRAAGIPRGSPELEPGRYQVDRRDTLRAAIAAGDVRPRPPTRYLVGLSSSSSSSSSSASPSST